MTDQVTFETQLRDMCERYGFRCDIIFPEGHVKIYWEDGVILYKDSISKSLYRFIREFRDIDVDYFECYQIPPPPLTRLSICYAQSLRSITLVTEKLIFC